MVMTEGVVKREFHAIFELIEIDANTHTLTYVSNDVRK